uniref:Transcription elongation factor SPT6-like n=1 Tax=Sinocyclocheilus anshuiensis TaxID=1608454 RepID=A0A671S5H2_9TELE
MSDFIESEAEESEEEFEEKDLKPKKTQKFMQDDEEEEEENTEDQDEHGNLRGLIDDGDVEEEEAQSGGEDSDSGEEVRHRRRKRSYDDYLDDDDLDLIEENLGVKVKRRKKKYSRVKTMDDEGEDDEKDLIADEIFTGDGDGDGEVEDGETVDTLHPRDDEEEEDDEESDIDDFIVDDDGQPITKKKGKKFSGYTDAALQEAQEIFGGDFDFAEFDTEAYDHAEEEEEDQDDESWDRPKKQTKRRVGRRSIFEIYEPSELESSHMTDQDNEIRSTDMPERFQLRAIPVKPAIFESTDYLDRGTTTNFSRKGPSTIAKIKEALNFMRNQHFEVPFIAFYRKEYVEPELNINDLWKVWQWDEKVRASQNELKNKLVAEAKDNIIKSCCKKLYNCLKVASYRPDQQVEEDDDLMDESQGKGIRVLGVAFASGRDTPVFCSLINGEGEVVDFLRLPYFLKRRNAWREDEREKKLQDIENLKKFLLSKKPHVVAVAGENRDAHMVMEDIKRTISELEQDSSLPAVGVELVDNELAVLYMNGKKSEADFRDYPPLLRQAVSVARKIQDPLVEFAQVCSSDEDILCLKLHPLQEHVVKEELLGALYCEFINRVNEVGVDVNRAIAHPYTQSLVQYVCGLGPRKGSQLLKNRTQLVTMCHMGPKVFINCAGFIKIDTASLGDSTDSYIEVLDGSRVHPETYEWARKMAVDALEYDESAEDANPAGALEEILENPERLKDLDLDAFAEELERQGYGNKGITLYDIRAELSCRYKDLRAPYRPSNTEEVFNMLTKETPETFYIGKLITCVVTGIAHRRPQGESYDQAIRNDETGLWQCPFCQQDNFPELSEVWNHFDSGSCPGQAIGVRTRLDNAVTGFIPTKFLSDKVVKHPEERVKVGMTVHCRIMKVDIEKFNVDLTCRTSDLSDKNNEWKLPKDTYYDFDAEADDVKQEEEQKKKQQRTTYIKRVIAHPSFHNINFKQAEKMMESMDQGDVVIRPSSKGENHLTVTWKVADGIYQHVDVREEGKENAFSLGHTLWINTEEFEDLDEITARYVQPMAAFARDLLGHKYFQECNGGDRKKMEEILIRSKKEKPTFIPYFISACRDLPGKFILGYQPRGKPRIEYVTITPDGFRYRSQIFPTVNGLFRWFKDHYQDPVPGVTPTSSRTRTPASVNATPANINIADLTRAVNALPRNMTSQMFNAIAAVTGQGQNPNTTPAQWASSQYGYSGGSSAGGGGSSSAYHVFATPQQPMATPMMTPSYSYTTPGQQQAMTTPQYPSSTPQSSHGHHQHSSSTPSSSSSRVRTPQPKTSSHTAVDWGKMAEQWLQEKEAERRKQKTPRVTPRPSPSPMIESTPMSIAGDATPLLDEMDR